MKLTTRLIAFLLTLSFLGWSGAVHSDTAAPVNLLTSADDFNSGPWQSFVLNTKVTPNAAVSPDNSQDATHLVVGGFIGEILPAAVPGHLYVFSTWMKSATGSDQQVSLAGENNPPAADSLLTPFNVGPEWKRFYIVYKCPDGGNSNFRLSYRAGDIFVWHPMVEDVTGKASQTPSDVPGIAATATGSAARPPAPAAKPGSKNLLKSTDDFASSAWTSFNAQATITPNATESPNKTKDAAHFAVGQFVGQVIDTAIPGHTYVFSTWMKSATGADQSVQLAGENNPPAPDTKFTPFTVTSDWQRFSIVFKCPDGGNSNFRFSWRAGDIYVWHPQVEDVTGNASQTPTDYVERPRPAPLKQLVLRGPPPHGLVQNVACWGDSLTAGAGGTPYPSDIALSPLCAGRNVMNGGVGGETSSQIKRRFLAAPEHFGDLVVIWAGRNNYDDSDTVKADIAEMVDQLTTDRFVVLSVLNMQTEPKGGGSLATINRLNQDLAKRYQGHYLDVRTTLVNAYDKSSAQDIADHDSDCTPSSLRSDKIHLNTAGYQLVSNMVLDFFKANKWV